MAVQDGCECPWNCAHIACNDRFCGYKICRWRLDCHHLDSFPGRNFHLYSPALPERSENPFSGKIYGYNAGKTPSSDHILGGVHRGSLAGLRYARMLSDDITAVHISIDAEETERIEKKWEKWGEGVRLVILESPYRLFLEPFLEYIDQIDALRHPNELITIVVPHFVSRRYFSNLLHARTANTLREVLLHRKEIVITEVPYEVD